MIRNNKFEQIEKYLSGELTGDALSEFNAELAYNTELAEEVRIQEEIQQAVQETDIMNLRENLKNIINQEQKADKQARSNPEEQAFSFELSEELSSFKEFSQPVNLNDFMHLSQSLPKIHLAQHNIAAKENIHHFYKEQQEQHSAPDQEFTLSPADEAIFEDVQAALQEKDIQDLRANLKQIAANIPAHQRTPQEIEQYNNNELDEMQLIDFEQELLLCSDLEKDIELYKEIDQATAETDIMDLRASLQSIQQTEVSTTQKMEEIDQYINLELTDEKLAAFEAELAENPDLEAEIRLINDIDAAIQENEIMDLRAKLGTISKEINRQEKQKRSFAARFSTSRIAVATVAASLILIFSIAGLVSKNSPSSNAELYSQFYSPYETSGIFRSGDALIDTKLTKALHQFNESKYQEAINLFSEVLEIDPNNPVSNFYSGMAYQETKRTDQALTSYHSVIKDRDNLFIEQAQWYIGLCYLQNENRKKAYRQ
ncbi:tetratricopeptide repeat protein, partial [uncultured Sunxiuqinia sp.]|uniref:tetratricopeptide repeat protein n=3 Tax=uncultured Sunxiuqinia sp. TaxID=1573825 RepID=UPI0026142061